ncbi:MAG: rhaM [Hyphomicrobiales bacterium]|nr:rhaM [Hyphomicrobiales bacterium]
MSERVAFRMNLNPGQAAEYKRRHDNLWPEMIDALHNAGVSDYSIWLDPQTNYLFATLVRTDDHTMADLPKTDANRRWWEFMADVMAYDGDRPVVVDLVPMFHLP